ncbi:c-type cytochrome [Nocardioides sp. NPDC057772]|uniref:cytochrome bc1 complex diheme cytochrome c subunit n=1 Tax=Nocardioides sp. NPDC057772 TaxID=3346245 RepID=UPI00366FC8EC
MRLLNRSVGRLSRHRRRPLAGAAVLLVALLSTGGAYAALAPASQAEQEKDNAALVAEGKELFMINCSTCHGSNGEGITTQNGKLYGPSLIGVGAASVDFQVGTGRMPMAQPGAQVEVKDPSFNQDEIDAMAAYVASLGPGPAIPDKEQYDPETYASEKEKEEAVTLGGQIFLTNCTACHNFTGAGGAMPRGGEAPSILNTDPKHIYEAMLTGPQSMDTFSDGNISPEEKKAVISYVESMKEQPDYGGFNNGRLGPVTEGIVAWVVGLGVLVAFAVWIASHTTRTNQTKKGSAQ